MTGRRERERGEKRLRKSRAVEKRAVDVLIDSLLLEFLPPFRADYFSDQRDESRVFVPTPLSP